ncbi:MAG TPA: carboxypeptidase-like regulatory domain-containing protein [Longimicrobiales bacterium]|nr:carboxypeptidase-like regulatory domain-containing protein [Longimicrobiales bacterium]
MNRANAVLLFVVSCGLAAYPAALAGQSMRGRVVDEPNRQGLADARVRLLSSDSSEIASTSTDATGFFEFEDTPHAAYYIDATMPGYATSSRAVSFASGNELAIPAFVLAPTVMELDTIQATARSERPAPPVGFSRTSYVLSGEMMAVLEQHSVPIHNAVRQLGSLRVRIIRQSGRDLHCIESTRRMASSMRSSSSRQCENVAVVVDGVVIGDPMVFTRDTRLYDMTMRVWSICLL